MLGAVGITRRRLIRSLRTAWEVSWLGPGIEQRDPTPSTLIYDEPHAQLRRVQSTATQVGDPVLLVTPLAVPTSCWDLRPGQSLAGWLAGTDADAAATSRPTYIIDYGTITFADRTMGFEAWFDDILPRAITEIAQRHSSDVHLVGWSLGGTLSILTAGYQPDLPIASIVAVGTPIDYGVNASVQPLIWLDRRLGTKAITGPSSILGGVPAPLVRALYRSMAPKRELTKPLYLIQNLDNREALAHSEAIDTFIGSMPGYPGRMYNQLHTRLIMRRELATGQINFGRGYRIDLANLTPPTLFVGSSTDTIASSAAVAAGPGVLTGARETAYAAADGLSHLGLIAAPAARTKSWPLIGDWLVRHDS